MVCVNKQLRYYRYSKDRAMVNSVDLYRYLNQNDEMIYEMKYNLLLSMINRNAIVKTTTYKYYNPNVLNPDKYAQALDLVWIDSKDVIGIIKKWNSL